MIEPIGRATRLDGRLSAGPDPRDIRAMPRDRNTDDAQDLFSRGHKAFTAGDHREAIECFSRAIRLRPDVAAAYRYRAYAYLELGDRVRALNDLDAAIRLKPDDVAGLRRPRRRTLHPEVVRSGHRRLRPGAETRPRPRADVRPARPLPRRTRRHRERAEGLRDRHRQRPGERRRAISSGGRSFISTATTSPPPSHDVSEVVIAATRTTPRPTTPAAPSASSTATRTAGRPTSPRRSGSSPTTSSPSWAGRSADSMRKDYAGVVADCDRVIELMPGLVKGVRTARHGPASAREPRRSAGRLQRGGQARARGGDAVQLSRRRPLRPAATTPPPFATTWRRSSAIRGTPARSTNSRGSGAPAPTRTSATAQRRPRMRDPRLRTDRVERSRLPRHARGRLRRVRRVRGRRQVAGEGARTGRPTTRNEPPTTSPRLDLYHDRKPARVIGTADL